MKLNLLILKNGYKAIETFATQMNATVGFPEI